MLEHRNGAQAQRRQEAIHDRRRRVVLAEERSREPDEGLRVGAAARGRHRVSRGNRYERAHERRDREEDDEGEEVLTLRDRERVDRRREVVVEEERRRDRRGERGNAPPTV